MRAATSTILKTLAARRTTASPWPCFAHVAHPLLGLDPTSANLKALSAAQAGIIYRANYWNIVRGDSLDSQELANNVFDFYVTSGTHSSSLLQRVINDLGNTPPLVVNGILGDATLAALKNLPASEVYAKFKQGRIDFYTALGVKFPRFLKGWVKRASSFPDLPPAA